jgi:hypothetical protein
LELVSKATEERLEKMHLLGEGGKFGFVCTEWWKGSRKSEAGLVQLQNRMERPLLLPQWAGIGKF